MFFKICERFLICAVGLMGELTVCLRHFLLYSIKIKIRKSMIKPIENFLFSDWCQFVETFRKKCSYILWKWSLWSLWIIVDWVHSKTFFTLSFSADQCQCESSNPLLSIDVSRIIFFKYIYNSFILQLNNFFQRHFWVFLYIFLTNIPYLSQTEGQESC